MIPQFRNLATIAVRGNRRAAQVVAEQEVQRAAALAHRHPLAAGVVVLDHRGRTAGPLEVGTDVVRRHAAHYGLDAVAVAVVGGRLGAVSYG